MVGVESSNEMSMDDIEAVFNKEFKQSSNLDNSHSSSSSLNLCADLLEVFNDMFDQSSSLRPSSTDRARTQTIQTRPKETVA